MQSATAKASSVTFVCCIESGPLEPMTLRCIASLRRFGGNLATAPVVAVTPRAGLPLARSTRNALEASGVTHISLVANERYAWNNFMNKPHALMAAAQHATTPTLCWLDSDVLIAAPPTRLDLVGDDFAACAPDMNVGSTGPDDRNEPYWLRILEVLGVNPATLPWVETCVEKARIRWYFNSGVFSFRREGPFAPAFLDDCRKLLDARFASHSAGIFFTDQVAMGLTAHRLGLTTDILPHAYNLAIGSKSAVPDDTALRNACILHYHDALWPAQWQRTITLLGTTRPEMVAFLREAGPIAVSRTLPERLVIKLFRILRTRQLRRHLAACQIV